MKNFLFLFLFLIFIKSFSQTPIYQNDQVSNITVTNITTGESNLDFRGNQVINLSVKAGGSSLNLSIPNGSSPKVNIKLFVQKTNANPVMIGSAYNVPVSTSGIVSSAYRTFTTSLNYYDYSNGGVMYCIVENAYGAQYSFLSRKHQITNCPYIQPPTNISATLYSYGYTIGFSPAGACHMEFVDLTNNNSGSTMLYSSSTPGQGNFFYYVPQNHVFKFRLKSASSNCSLFSNWLTVDPAITTCSSIPTNLILTSQCAPSPPSYGCGAYVRWDALPEATAYQFEYLIYNLSGQSKSGTSSCSGNSFTFNDYVSSLGAGPWYVKFKVKSKCVNNVWSDFSPWSATYVW